MGKHSNFLSKTLKTIPYPKKGSDRRLGKDNKLSQLEEELAQHKRQEQISSKQLADARAESALWQKKYDQLHAMVGRHVYAYTPSPRLATIPLLFALAALTRLAQREKPVYHPTGYFDAAGAGIGGSGIVLKLLAANIILVAVLGEGARWMWL
ncbi:hypothetical protein SLS54_005618, partial [Diplodia seriata]